MINQTKLKLSKLSLFFLITFFTFNVNAQISFQEGYYIDNLDNKINCLIKNVDKRNNPTEFEYRLSEDSEIKITTIKYVKEFGFYNLSKYVRATVDIDNSQKDTKGIGKDKYPVFVSKTLFLKVLLEGKANLYKYEERSSEKFFYSIDGSKIEQLVYKIYYYKDEKNSYDYRIAKNNNFRNQIWIALKCPTISMNKLKNLEYKKMDLKDVFTEYNTCTESKNIDYDKKPKKNLFNLTLRPGLNISSLKVIESRFGKFDREIDFGYQSTFRFGIEAEVIVPFNRNKWALFFEPVYQSYKSETEQENEMLNGTASANYTSIELNIGIRHYIFINDKAKIFLNGGYMHDRIVNSEIDFSFAENPEIRPSGNIAFGVGFNYNDRYSFEARYITPKDLLWNAGKKWDSSYQTFSFIFGYSIF